MTAPVISRISLRLSLDGLRAGCVTVDDHGRGHVEQWELSAAGPQRHSRWRLDGDPYSAMMLPLSDGRLLCSRWRSGQPARQHLAVFPDGADTPLTGPGLRLLAVPAGYGAALGIGAANGEGGAQAGTGFYLISDDLSRVEMVADTPDRIGNAVVVGHRLLMSGQRDGQQRVLELDLSRRTLSTLAEPTGGGRIVPLLASAGAVLFGLDTRHGHRLGRARVGDPGAVREFTGPEHVNGSVLPIALTPDGDEVLLRVHHGAATSVLRHHLSSGRSRPLPLPPGVTASVAAFTCHGAWLAHSTPTAPTTWWWQSPGEDRPQPAEPDPGGWTPGVTTMLPGAEGPLEAVVYGPDWATASRVIVALHGGPSEHWSLAFDHRLQQLAADGACVIAVNQRGSTGYGHDHEYAIKGAWGHPDLADVLAVARHVHSVRPAGSRAPGLFGVSYGAYLGLLAMAYAPELWSACVAVAPFLSARRLYPEASPGVRALIERLDATSEPPGCVGARDLLSLAGSVTGRILLIHGENDLTIPVSHSRALIAALRERSSATVTYREVPGRGHQPVGPGTDPLATEITDFLSHCGDVAGDVDDPARPEPDGRRHRAGRQRPPYLRAHA